jgi:hypothetical protein
MRLTVTGSHLRRDYKVDGKQKAPQQEEVTEKTNIPTVRTGKNRYIYSLRVIINLKFMKMLQPLWHSLQQ